MTIVVVGMIPPGVLRLSQSMEEHGQLRRGRGVGGFQPVTSDPDVAAVGTQSHPDRQGAVGVAQPVADLCVESGERQVRSLLIVAARAETFEVIPPMSQPPCDGGSLRCKPRHAPRSVQWTDR